MSNLSQPYVAPKKEMIRLLLKHPQHTLDFCHHFLGSFVWSTRFLDAVKAGLSVHRNVVFHYRDDYCWYHGNHKKSITSDYNMDRASNQ